MGVRDGAGAVAVGLIAVAVPVVINRLFGFGLVLLDVFSGKVLLGLSASLALGGLLGCWLYRGWSAGRIMVRRA